MSVPIISLEIQGMKSTIKAALMDQAVALDKGVQDALDKLCTEENVARIVEDTMNANELKAEIDRRRAALQPALREIKALESRHSEAASREFIATHGITADMVQISNIEGTWHGTVSEFGKWMEANGCTKPWAEWNGRLYPTIEIKAGILRREAPGMAKHVGRLARS